MIATVRPRASSPPHAAMLECGGERFPCAIGVNGVTPHKVEGDGATPAGALPLRRVLFRADRVQPPPHASVPRAPLTPDAGWCDDPRDAAYNRPVRLPYGARAETLWRDDPLYDVIGVLGWNDAPVLRERGSAIFLHLATADLGPTAGCIALLRADLLRLLGAGLSGFAVDPTPC